MAGIKLSLLILTIPSRKHFFVRIKNILADQVMPWYDEIEILTDGREGISIGDKRNELLYRAKGEYCAWIDDDDKISDHYISHLMLGIESGVDCCSLTGIITENSKNPKRFIHSLKYTDWFEKDGVYYRPPNHLNCMKTSIAKRVGFPGKNHGEDKDFSMEICKQGLLKTEHEITDVIYFYEYISPEVRKQLNYH